RHRLTGVFAGGEQEGVGRLVLTAAQELADHGLGVGCDGDRSRLPALGRPEAAGAVVRLRDVEETRPQVDLVETDRAQLTDAQSRARQQSEREVVDPPRRAVL